MHITYTMDGDVIMEALQGFDRSVSWAAEEDFERSIIVVSHGLDRHSDCSSHFTDVQLKDAVDAIQAARASTAYSGLRAVAYSLLNQDEMRFDDLVNGTTTWVDAINQIKLDHPKGG